MFKTWVIDLLKGTIDNPQLEVPPNEKLGDYAVPCFELAKKEKKSPVQIAQELAEKLIPTNQIQEIKATGPYLNFFLNKKEVAKVILTKVFEEKKNFAKQPKKNKTVIIDYSSPNIAKPFSIGHLRSTIIGNSLMKLKIHSGYKAIGVNHLGDWGTQFGKEIAAWKKWGSEEELKKDPIMHLLSLYTKFHEEAEKDESLLDEGRDWFAKLEQGDKEATQLWEKFREVSLNEFKRVYRMLNVSFDFYHGEAFYKDMNDDVIAKFKEKGLVEESEGAQVIEVGLKHAPPVMLVKSNGTTTYHTRDFATAFYRIKEFNPHKIIYCVGKEQKMHFETLFKALELYGHDPSMFEHVWFGHYRFPEGKMSTRKGNVIFMEDVLNKSIELVKKVIEEKNPNLKNKDRVAQMVGVGAIAFGDIVNDCIKDISFDWDKILDFNGDTGPYLQYTHARCCAILRKAEHGASPKVDWEQFNQAEEEKLIMDMAKFEDVIDAATHQYKPHLLARFLLDLAQDFNKFYAKCPVLSEVKDIEKARLLLVDSVRQVLEVGLNLLGIEAPEEM